jgi:hypothetical protein
MSTTPSILNGQESSATLVNQTFAGLQAQGAAVLALLTNIQLTTLVDYGQCLTAVQSKQQRAARVKATEVAGLFVVSDLDSINQGLTTATVRVDTASATLRERHLPATALVTSTAFSASNGLVNSLNQDQTLFSVNSSTTPTGTFTLQLQQAVTLSVLTIDVVAMSSSPTVTVQVSSDGLVYTPANTVALNGSVLNAWFGNTEVLYIQIVLTPAQPDSMGGNIYTFGITDFSATTVSYNLVSDIYFKTLTLAPESQNLLFRAQGTGSLLYNLLLSDGTDPASYLAVTDGSVVPVPGVASVTTADVAIGTGGVLAIVIPGTVYPNSLSVLDTTANVLLPVIVGLSPADPNLASLNRTVAVLNGATITILPVPGSLTDVFTVSYLAGPASISATLLVHLSTTDRTQTPVFNGASLEEI